MADMDDMRPEDFGIIDDVICFRGQEISEQEVLEILHAALSYRQLVRRDYNVPSGVGTKVNLNLEVQREQK